MTDYWHSLSMPRLQDLHQHQHQLHSNSQNHIKAGCLSDDASDSSTQSMRLFLDSITATTLSPSHAAAASTRMTTTTTVAKDIMGTTPPSSASASDTETYIMHSNDKVIPISTSKTDTSLSFANCSKAPLAHNSKTPSPTIYSCSVSSGSGCSTRRLLAARSRSRTSLTATAAPEGSIPSSTADATVSDVVPSTPVSQQQQQAPVVVKRAKFFVCEDSDDDDDDDDVSDYEQHGHYAHQQNHNQNQEQEQEQEQQKEVSSVACLSGCSLTKAPLVHTTTRSRLPVFEEYDEYDEYDHEEEEDDFEDEEDDEDGPLFFGKRKPSITVIASSQPTPQQKPTIPAPGPGSRSHLPSPPQNAGMERRQSLLSDLLLADKQQKQLLLLHQQRNQRSLTSSTCSTPNCLSAANSDGEGCTSSSSSSGNGSSGHNNGSSGGRPHFSTTALTPIYPAPSTTTTTTTATITTTAPLSQYLSQHQHQTLEPNRIQSHPSRASHCHGHRRTFVDPPSETEPDNLLKEDKLFLDNIKEEEAFFAVPKLVRTKKIYHRLDTLAATTAAARAPSASTITSPTSPAYTSPLSPISTCTISTLSPTTTTTTTTKTTVATITTGATTTTTVPRAPTTSAASATTMAGWARSQVQVQFHSLVAHSTTTAQRAFLTAQSTLSDVLYRTGAK
ncbi:hypothetical protein BGZ47_003692 [Haplosporangium gracile]|nr:hypothetical protein BGZ47_003692 [Haplosporangium gracile]